MTAELMFNLCQRFPMCFGAVVTRMQCLEMMERNRHDNPWECECYGFEETSRWEAN